MSATFDLEYTICQIQQGSFSMAARSHRQEGGNPQLTISMLPDTVEWRLTDLEHGVPETVAGQPRKDRVDFYFLYDDFKSAFAGFPAPRVAPAAAIHRFPPTHATGTERVGGKLVREITAVCRFSPVTQVSLFSQQPPAFHGIAVAATLHLDMESGPSRIYGKEVFEVHFGVEGNWDISPLASPVPSEAVLVFTDAVYATIYSELSGL
jgi:hypothetical protein